MKYNLIFIFLLFIGNPVFSQLQTIRKIDGTTVTPSQVDLVVKKLMDTAHIQGLNLAVLNNNKTVFIKSYGFRNKPEKALMDTGTIVYGASFSKAVFGYLIMKLTEEKVLALDKPLYQYLKKPIAEYEYFSDLQGDSRWKSITARMCLDHTTGLPNVRWFHPKTGKQDTIGTMKIYFNPGTKYAYSGEGYKLLQLVVEEITGKNIDELAREKIFNPFAMTRTGYIWHESFGDSNVAVGHMNNGDINKKKKRTEPVAGGSLVTTIADYTQFIENMMQQKGMSKKLYREMLSPQIAIYSKTQFPPIQEETTTENKAIHLSYGLGWGYLKCPRYGKAFFKEGNGISWRNYNINFPEKGISVIIMINSENGEKVFQELVETVVGDTCIPWKWQDYIPYNQK
ncbi:serine hydrolase domain-containing protein [Chryseobacterium sp. OV279]|uniref:serine hydrolase domain-containing protein n=1 Tax=Chryseobacterium sp. OV279 TaxID=1500285 RepID=UPI00091A1DF9|nr:serine hydrolase domain-containing protein [Chryseobacterium sp. OV279]SHF62230.1 CubicO group peptidase, beta-lactamase class C family [Chryseobacterium sp. OV279]